MIQKIKTTYTYSITASSILFKDMAKEWFEFTIPHIKESTKVKYYNIWNTYIS